MSFKRIFTIAILLPVALIMILIAVSAVIGGGFGKKQRGMSGSLHTNEPLILTHRGDTREYPENSRAALNAARENGFEAVEIDIKRSADGQFYLFHDRNSSRLLGVDINLSQQSLDELQNYPLHHNGVPTSEHVLSLEEYAAEFSDDFVVYLHSKRHGDKDLQRRIEGIREFIYRHELQERSIVGGEFLLSAWFEYRYPELNTSIGGPGDFRIRAYRWIPKRFRPDFIVVHADKITPGHVRWLRKNNLMHRWIIYGIDSSNRERIEQWGFSKFLVG